MFGMPAAGGGAQGLVQMKAGKLNLEGTTITADPRKGLLVLRKSEDGLMHLIWSDRTANSVVDDLIVFEGDATIRKLEECKDGYAMLLEFSQTQRRLFFYSQEPRKKGKGWEDTAKEKETMDKINAILTGGPSAAAPAGGANVGALGMSHAELMAMLGGAPVPQGGATAPASTAPAPATAGESPTAPAAATAAATGAPAAPAFSADSISSILSGIPAPPAGPAAAGAPAFSADAISSILSGIGPGAGPPVALNDVLHPGETVPRVDAAMEEALAEHLPAGGTIPESARESITTPQVAQASTDANKSSAAASGAEAMDTDDKPDEKPSDKMNEG